jgi:chromosomal replication initiator protein
MAHRLCAGKIGQESTMSDMDVVSAICAKLADSIGADRLKVWFGTNTRLSVSGETLAIESANEFAHNWLRTHYRPQIEAACTAVLGPKATAEFRVDESLLCEPTTKKAAMCAPRPLMPTNGPSDLSSDGGAKAGNLGLFQPEEPDSSAATAAQHGSIAAAAEKKRSAGHEMRRPRQFSTMDTFVIGPCNRLAQASAQMAAERLGSLTPLVIHGPPGCGKTHLLESVLTAARRHHQGLNAVYLSAEQFTISFLEALRGGGLPSFRRKYRGVDLLVIDDLQFLAGKQATMKEMLYTIDTLGREHRQLVLSADRPPAELAQLGPELTTRLSAGMVCRVDHPDLPTRIGIVREFAKRLEMSLPDDVVQYVAAQITAGARHLCGAVNKLHASSRMLAKAVDMQMTIESLADSIRAECLSVRLADIDRAVCDVFGVSKENLKSAGRTANMNTARILAMWLARKHTRAGLTEIGEHFGRRSHSTVISAQRRVETLLANRTEVLLAERPCAMEEAIRQVEQRLRVG